MSGIIPRNTSRAGVVADFRFVANISISSNSLARVMVFAVSSYLIYKGFPYIYLVHRVNARVVNKGSPCCRLTTSQMLSHPCILWSIATPMDMLDAEKVPAGGILDGRLWERMPGTPC